MRFHQSINRPCRQGSSTDAQVQKVLGFLDLHDPRLDGRPSPGAFPLSTRARFSPGLEASSGHHLSLATVAAAPIQLGQALS